MGEVGGDGLGHDSIILWAVSIDLAKSIGGEWAKEASSLAEEFGWIRGGAAPADARLNERRQAGFLKMKRRGGKPKF